MALNLALNLILNLALDITKIDIQLALKYSTKISTNINRIIWRIRIKKHRFHLHVCFCMFFFPVTSEIYQNSGLLLFQFYVKSLKQQLRSVGCVTLWSTVEKAIWRNKLLLQTFSASWMNYKSARLHLPTLTPSWSDPVLFSRSL